MKTIFLFALFAAFAITSCNIINPSEPLPGYIYVENIEFTGQFSNSQNITEIWVYDQHDLIGIFDLPAMIPVLKKGTANYKFFAGIKENGISSNRTIYPFYTGYETIIDIQDLKIDTIVPHFEYKDNIVMPAEMKEDFENNFTIYHTFGSSDTTMVITSDPNEIFSEDNSLHSGKVVYESTFTIWQAESNKVSLPQGEEIWAELNYKSNNSFAVGLRPYYNGSPETLATALVIKNTTDDNGVEQWKKIYVHLSTAAGSFANASEFSFYLQASKDPDVELPLLFFDNIKVIHFEQ